MNNYFVILAAGKSKRFHKNLDKQFHIYKNREIIEHSIEKSLNSKLFKKIIVVTNNPIHFKNKIYFKSIKIIKGGKERSDSTLNALKFIKKYKPKNVFIHDAARPNFSIRLLKKITDGLKKNKAVVPIISSKDSIKYKIKNRVFNIKRNDSFLTQTPQAFAFKELYNLAINQNNKVSDEASLFINNDYKSQITIAKTVEEASINADAIILITEWEEFRTIKWEEVSYLMRKPSWIFDLRSVININEVSRRG